MKKEGTVNLDLKRYHELIDTEKVYKQAYNQRKDDFQKKVSEAFETLALKTANSVLKLKLTKLEAEIEQGESKFKQMSLIQFYRWKKNLKQ